MKKNLLIIFLLLFSTFVFASPDPDPCLYYFYGEGCPHCGRVKPHMEYLQTKYKDLNIDVYEIYNERSNLLILQDFFNLYDVPDNQRGVPVVFIGNKYFVGDNPILNHLEDEIKERRELKKEGEPCPDLPELEKENIVATGIADAKSPLEKLGSVPLATIIAAALVDSINPCAIAVLLILMAALLAAGGKKRALKAGIAFTASIYIAYFLFGLGLFSVIQISGLSYLFYKFIGLLAVLVGLANIKDSIWYGAGGFVMEIPRSWRPTIKKLLGKVTSPLGAFLMGFAVCLFELPCTGGPYLFILGLLAERTTQLLVIPILLLYNIFFVLPLILITLLMYAGFTNVEKAGAWKDRNIKKIHLITGLVMLALGLAVILELV